MINPITPAYSALTRTDYNALNYAQRRSHDRLAQLLEPGRPLWPSEAASLRRLAAMFGVRITLHNRSIHKPPPPG